MIVFPSHLSINFLQKSLTDQPVYVAQALFINIFQGGASWLTLF